MLPEPLQKNAHNIGAMVHYLGNHSSLQREMRRQILERIRLWERSMVSFKKVVKIIDNFVTDDYLCVKPKH